LCETGTVKVAVAPAPPEAGIPGHHFRIEIVRETQGGGDQHVDWIDVSGDNTYGRSRGIDFRGMTFKWDGIPVAPFGSAANQAQGRDVFVGVAASANRLLPAVTLGQPVPPPFVTAVAKIVRDSDGTVVAEARKRIFVPQVIKITYDTESAVLMKSGYQITTNGVQTYLISPMSDTEWEAQKGRICAIAQIYYDAAGANVRFVDVSRSTTQPFSTLAMIYAYTDGSLGLSTGDFQNTNPSDGGTLFSLMLKNSALGYYLEHPEFGIPITAREVGNIWANIVAHECGHMLGLVAPNDILDGTDVGTEDDTGGWHNKNPINMLYIMNAGSDTNFIKIATGRMGAHSWKGLNANYLNFVLPKE
jgi:hypothetical protein